MIIPAARIILLASTVVSLHDPAPILAATTDSLAAPPACHPAAELTTAFYPDGTILTPVVTADHGSLHLEARYNYEGTETGSAFLGWNFAHEGDVSFAITPLIGGVVGEVDGVVAGARLVVGWRSLEFASETEWVEDLENSEESSLFSWSDLTWSFSERWFAGFSAQRTRLYDGGRDVQPGVSAGVTLGTITVMGWVFNPTEDDVYPVFSLMGEW